MSIPHLSLSFKFLQTIARSIEACNTDSHAPTFEGRSVFQIELFHEQLPLPVPCYDLVPVTELTLGPTYVDTSGIPGSLDLTGEYFR